MQGKLKYHNIDNANIFKEKLLYIKMNNLIRYLEYGFQI